MSAKWLIPADKNKTRLKDSKSNKISALTFKCIKNNSYSWTNNQLPNAKAIIYIKLAKLKKKLQYLKNQIKNICQSS